MFRYKTSSNEHDKLKAHLKSIRQNQALQEDIRQTVTKSIQSGFSSSGRVSRMLKYTSQIPEFSFQHAESISISDGILWNLLNSKGLIIVSTFE